MQAINVFDFLPITSNVTRFLPILQIQSLSREMLFFDDWRSDRISIRSSRIL